MGIRTGRPKGRPKGAPNKHTRERARLVEQAAAAVEGLLPDPFKGDAHAYLMTIYKDTTLPLQARMAAAIGALPYEKPRLASTKVEGGDEPVKIETVVTWVGLSAGS